MRLSVAFLFYFFITAPALAEQSLIQTSAKQAIVIDYDTGMTLLEKEADTRMPTSSMSKVMTAYLVFEALKEGKLSLDEKLRVSEKAWRKGGSKMFVEVDKYVKVEDLLRGVIVQSGNDATIVLAEALGGSEDNFAMALTDKAHELGMKNSNFVNASGWPNPNHYSTARDLSILATALIRNFPKYYSYYGEKEFAFNNIAQRNRNPLLYRNIGADGIKTGHTEAGGYGVMGSGTKNGRRIILVINGLESNKARAQESAKLLDWGLNRFENHTLFKAGEKVESAAVVMGKSNALSLTVKNDITVTIPRISMKEFKVIAKFNEPLQAPIQKGDEIGTLIIDIPHMGPVEQPLYAAEDIEELGFFSKILSKAKLLLSKGSV